MIGKTVSHYKIIEKLGAGGMGEVYKAEDLKLERTVALKFLPSEYTRDDEAKDRFIREAKAASSLEHPNICTIHEVNETDDGQLYIVMSCYEGETLKDKIKDERLMIKDALDIFVQIAEGLAKAHEKGIVHRDIKPANIFVTADGLVKILDFGLAKLVGQAQLTKDSSTLGTVAYMSPEQLSGKEIDQRTDIWSLGVVLYEMLVGKQPFKGDYEQAVIYSIINDEPESPLNIKSKLPVELNQIINKALKKNPQQRYQNIDELKSELDTLNLSNKFNYYIRETDQNKSKKIRKNVTIGLTILILTIVVGIGYMLLNRSQENTRIIDSLAVLPLENLSGDTDQEYFSDGMTEALITELSRIKALKVISRTSVMQFKNSRKALPEIAEQLHVAAVVEGSVLKAGNKVRITAQLIDAESDRHLWAESYERNLRDILTVQKEVAKSIALQIKTNLTPAEENILNKETSIDPVAHEAYLKGNYFLNQVSVGGARKSIEYFNRIIEIEPEYAPAYTSKALAYNTILSFNAIPPKEGWVLVREWAEKALKIDKNSSDAILLMADVKFIYEWDWPGAEKAYQKSIELNPNNSRAYNWYATFLSSMGRNSEALSLSQKSTELAPLSIAPYYNGIIIRVNAGLFEQADALLKKVKELHPNHPISPGIEGLIYLESGKYQQALPLFQSQLTGELSPGMKDLARSRIAFVFAQLGDEKKSREMLEYLINRSRTHYVSPTRIALIYSALGEIDEAFAWLDRAYNERCDDLPFMLKPSHLLDKLRPDPRFQDLIKRMKLD